MASRPVWRVAVDTGGTFTDCLAIDPEGGVHRRKLLSSGALRVVLGEPPSLAEPGEPPKLVLAMLGEFPRDFFGGWTAVSASGTRVGVAGSEGNSLELTSEWPSGEAAGGQVTLESGEEAAVVAIRWVTGAGGDSEPQAVAVRLATTRGTNALLERKGAEVALFVTRGFGDLLEIGNQQRPDLFTLEIRKPDPLWAAVVEVEERLDSDGEVLRPLDAAALEARGRDLVASGIGCAAIAFLHSYRNPAHEEEAAAALHRAGFRHISRSSKLSQRIKIVARAQTAVVDAYLSETLGAYLDGVSGRLEPRTLHVMTSAGGLTGVTEFRAKDSLLSGPAAGVVGAAAAGRASGFERVIAFDMGGTSTDVSRVDGELELVSETLVGDARLLSPSVAVETVAAGGGSICHAGGGRVAVGPESAGAEPGPACYGAGGPLTLTDVNLLLGRLVPSRFPFEVDRTAASDQAAAVRQAAVGQAAVAGGAATGRRGGESGADAGHPGFATSDGSKRTSNLDSSLGGASGTTGGSSLEEDAFLAGFLAIANERMAGAIRAISVRRGYDPREYSLVAFGGAGGQHAVALAELLGIRRVLVPTDGALLSAVGLSAAPVERWSERQVLAPLADVESRLSAIFSELAAEATRDLVAEGVSPGEVESGPQTVFLRYSGQESALPLPWRTGEREGGVAEALEPAFEEEYRDLYGYLPVAREIEVESVRMAMRSVHSSGENVGHRGPMPPGDAAAGSRPAETVTQRFWDGRAWVEAPVLERSELSVRETLDGPFLVAESNTVTVVERGWSCRLDGAGALLLEKREKASS